MKSSIAVIFLLVLPLWIALCTFIIKLLHGLQICFRFSDEVLQANAIFFLPGLLVIGEGFRDA